MGKDTYSPLFPVVSLVHVHVLLYLKMTQLLNSVKNK